MIDPETHTKITSNPDYIAILLYLKDHNPNVILRELEEIVVCKEKIDDDITTLIRAKFIEPHKHKYRLTPLGRIYIKRIEAICVPPSMS